MQLPVAGTQSPVEAGLITDNLVVDAAVKNNELESAPNGSVEHAAAKAADGFPLRFPRSGRLLRHPDFDRVYKQGRRHFSSHMTVFYLRQAEGVPVTGAPVNGAPVTGSRVGFTVGKALGGAVVRNRIRRRLREAVRQRRSLLHGAAPVDVVINPKKSVLTLDFSLVLEEVGRALEIIAKKMVAK